MTEPLVTYDVNQDCAAAVITLNRPEERNPLSIELVEDLLANVRTAVADHDVRSLIVTGRGPAFAAGADIDELQERDHVSETGTRAEQRRQLTALLESTPKPTIAAINGHAMGGGLEIALSCTFRVAAEQAKLGLPEVGIGILPGNGGTQRLTRLVGVGHAMELILLGRPIDAARAGDIGLVHRVVPADDVRDAACQIAARLAELPRRSLAAAKESILAAWDLPVDSGIAYEHKWFSILCGSPDKHEGVAAFREKRTPKFD